jgi:hypothetical protein
MVQQHISGLPAVDTSTPAPSRKFALVVKIIPMSPGHCADARQASERRMFFFEKKTLVSGSLARYFI